MLFMLQLPGCTLWVELHYKHLIFVFSCCLPVSRPQKTGRSSSSRTRQYQRTVFLTCILSFLIILILAPALIWYMEREGQLQKDMVHYVLAFVVFFFHWAVSLVLSQSWRCRMKHKTPWESPPLSHALLLRRHKNNKPSGSVLSRPAQPRMPSLAISRIFHFTFSHSATFQSRITSNEFVHKPPGEMHIFIFLVHMFQWL